MALTARSLRVRCGCVPIASSEVAVLYCTNDNGPTRNSPRRDPARKAGVSRRSTRFRKQLGLRQAGITVACWHSLRHTAASRRIMARVVLVSVKEILGHRDIQTTLRYAHLAPGHLRDAVNRGSLSELVTKTATSHERERQGEF